MKRLVIKAFFHRYFPLLLALWILFVLYPNPLNLGISVHRLFSPAVEPGAVEPLLEALPSEPEAIEKAVLEQIPYHYDWEVYSMPWYFPTTEMVVENGRGDCKGRALILASIFEAEQIPYQLNCSPIHVWVEYTGKAETPLENPQVKFYQRDPETGERQFQFPDIGLREVMKSSWQGFWNPMPDIRKALLLSGIGILLTLRLFLFKNEAQGIDKIRCL